MEVPFLVEYGMVTVLCKTGIKVDVVNVLVGSRVPKENAAVVVVIQLGTSFPSTFDTDAGTEHFQVFKIREFTKKSFERGFKGDAMNSTIVEICGVD